jgi:ribonuclease HI
MAEAWAALHAFIFVKEIGMFNIILEGDAKYAGCKRDQFQKPTSK